MNTTKKLTIIELLERSLDALLRDSIHKKIDFFQFDGQRLPVSPGHWTASVFLIHNSNPRGRVQLILGEGDFLNITPSELHIWFNNLKNKYSTQSDSVFILIEPY